MHVEWKYTLICIEIYYSQINRVSANVVVLSISNLISAFINVVYWNYFSIKYVNRDGCCLFTMKFDACDFHKISVSTAKHEVEQFHRTSHGPMKFYIIVGISEDYNAHLK